LNTATLHRVFETIRPAVALTHGITSRSKCREKDARDEKVTKIAEPKINKQARRL
jgi:hypothetical protein